jgi:HD-GYP domain-containing protein (c-di-GMP phosphodiesterase class II)
MSGGDLRGLAHRSGCCFGQFRRDAPGMVVIEEALSQRGFMPISVSMIVPDNMPAMSLYLKRTPDAAPRLYRGAEYPVTNEDLAELLKAGIKTLYLSCSEHATLQQYLRENLSDVLHDESISLKQRFGALNEVMRDVLSECFKQGDTTETVQQIRGLGQRAVEMICRDDIVTSDICDVLYHDYHTFTHSANVAYYVVMLAKAIGISDPAQLEEMATGGLLHDLGKLAVPDAILTKPSRLEDGEYQIIKQHPTTGFIRLCDRKDLTFAQLMMVYQHHERLDGKGYPVGIVGKEIHEWARMTSVVDIFEALTANRPYRREMPAEEAFAIMDRQAGPALDPDIYQCWKMTIEQR